MCWALESLQVGGSAASILPWVTPPREGTHVLRADFASPSKKIGLSSLEQCSLSSLLCAESQAMCRLCPVLHIMCMINMLKQTANYWECRAQQEVGRASRAFAMACFKRVELLRFIFLIPWLTTS